MCMRFVCNPQIIFCHFFCSFDFYSQFLAQFLQKHIDTGYPVNAIPPTILAESF